VTVNHAFEKRDFCRDAFEPPDAVSVDARPCANGKFGLDQYFGTRLAG
jgi:hypothetical protein